MLIYLKLLGTILYVYSSIISLSSVRLHIRQILFFIGITEITAVILLTAIQYAALIPILVIASIYLYINTKKLIISFSLSLFSVVIILLSDSISSFIFLIVLHINLQLLEQNNYFYLCAYIFGFIIILFFSKLFGFLISKNLYFRSNKLDTKNLLLILLALILTIMIFYTNIIVQPDNGFTPNYVKFNLILFSCYFFILIILIYTLIKNITRDIEYKNKQLVFEHLKEYTDNLEILYTDIRKFRHDYINIMTSITYYLENNDITGLKKHFNDNILPLGRQFEANNFKLDLLKNIKSPELKGVLSSKLIRAQELNISVIIDIPYPIEHVCMDTIDSCRIMGILIDNAIDAALKCTKPTIKINIIKNTNSIELSIINNFTEELPPISKMFEDNFSTKGANRGLGLGNLKQIIDSYNNIYLNTMVNEGEFIQNIQIDFI